MGGRFYILFSDGTWSSCANKESVAGMIDTHLWEHPYPELNECKAFVIQSPTKIDIFQKVERRK